jgi:peroxiredoxin
MKIYLIILIIVNFCPANIKKFTVSGHIENKTPTSKVLFKAYNTLKNLQTVLDTIPVDSAGNFQKHFNYEPGIYQIDFAGRSKFNFAIENGQNLSINIQIPRDENKEVQLKIDGSPDARLVYEYDKLQKAAYKKWLHPVRRSIRLAKEAGEMARIPELQEQEKKNLIVYKNELADYARKNFGNSIALFYAAIRLDPQLHMKFLEEIAEKFNRLRPELMITKQFNEKIERLKKTAIGSLAPDIIFTDNDGQQIRLSDNRGKYVLLDFWAAWCNPCRIENINYAELYRKFKDKGFEIFAVSIDTNEKIWQNASKKDRISWTNISDLKGWGTSSAVDYNITAIPANFLIDPDGKIVDRNIRGKDLQDRLEIIFNQ